MNVISNEVKLSIAILAISGEMSNKAIAEKFGVGETSVRRAKVAFAAEAEAVIKAEAAAKLAEENASLDNYVGYRPRNGRMSIIRQVLAEMGADAPAAAIYDRVSKLSEDNGLKPIKKTAVYVLISQESKKLKV